MANALSNSPAPTPAPSALAGPSQQAAPQPQGAGAMQGQAPGQPPAPSHEQTVAAMRHFRYMARALEKLMADPAIGKSDLKSKVIDAMTKAVQDRMIGPGDAVVTLSSLPEQPLEQMKWVRQHFAQTMIAMNMVLDHHAAAFPPGNSFAEDVAKYPRTENPEDGHIDTMKGFHTHYQARRR